MKPDIDCLRNLSTCQLQQLRVFIETLGYRKAVERASEEFNQPLHKGALQRFMHRNAPAEFLENTPDNDEATLQILKFAADGRPDFTASTVHALEQLAFQLTLTCNLVDDDMLALTKVSAMLCRFHNATVRQRMAVVQEGKLKLRQQQFEKSENDGSDARIEDLNRKIAAAFRQHPTLTAIRNAQAAGLGTPGVPPVHTQAPTGSTGADDSAAASPTDETPETSETAPVPPKDKNLKDPFTTGIPSTNSSLKLAPASIPASTISPSANESLTPIESSYENTSQT